MTALTQYLREIGLQEKEQAVYLALAELGMQPASVLARHCGLDRVSTYRYAKRLADLELAKVFVRDGVQYFAPAWGEGIEAHLRDRMGTYERMMKEVADVDRELRGLSHGETAVPKLQIFEGKAGLKSLFRDIIAEAREQKILRMRMLTSNTFDQQLGNVPLSRFMKEFFDQLRERSLDMEIIEASGTLLPEYIRRIAAADFHLDTLPAARGATSIFLVGDAVYLACYGDTQIGLKIKQPQMSGIFHFLLDALSKNVPAATPPATEWLNP
jgi:sugar-specific transcriptional regulator TrmB